LSAILGWLEPLELELWSSAWPDAVAPAERSGKTLWVQYDLRARGMSAQEIAAIPRQQQLPPLSSVAQRFGVAYVIEGAQLGGQLLLRQLGPKLAPLPTRWLEGYGRETSGKWRAFLDALAVALPAPTDAERAAESARATFELAHAWFAQRGAA
jgi:heme oxygenase